MAMKKSWPDNGAHIQQYILESDEGSSVSGHFLSVFEGKNHLLKEEWVTEFLRSTREKVD